MFNTQAIRLWQQSTLDWFILLLCSFSIAVDVINGFFMLNGSGLPLSVAFKSSLLMLLLIRLSITDVRIAAALLAMLLLYLVPALRLFLLNGDMTLFVLDASSAVRTLFFLAFLVYIVATQPPIEKLALIAKVLTLCLLANLIVGAAGYGFPTYSIQAGFGVKGFVYAGNELAITAIALSFFTLFYWVRDKSWLIKMLTVAMVIGSGLLIATKSAMLGTFSVAALFVFLYARRTFFVLFISTIVFIAAFASVILEAIKSAGVLEHFFFVYNKRGLISLIFSNRNEFFITNLNFALENFGLFGWVFGWGQGPFTNFVKPNIEIDILDMYFFFGVSGIIGFIAFYYLLYRCLNNSGNFRNSPELIFIWVLVFFISFFAGHVVNSGLAAIPLTLALYAASDNRSKKNET